MFDWVSGYKHVDGPPDPNMSLAELRKAGYLLDANAWLNVCARIFDLVDICFIIVHRGSYSWKVSLGCQEWLLQHCVI